MAGKTINRTCSFELITQEMGSFSTVHRVMSVMEELSKELVLLYFLQHNNNRTERSSQASFSIFPLFKLLT